MICIQLKIKCKIILLKTLENRLNKSYFMTYHYFTKRVEVEPLATITEKNVKNFVWNSVICRFGIPKVLISDNGKQFDNQPFQELCSQLSVKNHFHHHGTHKLMVR